MQQSVGQPHRAFPRAEAVAAETQHPRTDGEHDRLDRVAQAAACRDDGTGFRVQRDQPPGRARPQAPSALAGGLRSAATPRTVPSGRPSWRAITRCPSPPAASRSASPITSAPSRRRGTSHEGDSTCVVSHDPQRARRGVTHRAPSRIRTSRERANPHGDNRPEHAGHANSPAASATSTRSWVIAIESIEDRQLAHGRRTLPDVVTARKGQLVWHTYHTPRQGQHATTAASSPP
jgi:hypothetical protein